jgi:hypothetical protein
MNTENLINAGEIILAAIVGGSIAFFMLFKYLRYEETRDKLSLDKARLEIVIPARMQAYERIILFLERTQPENLVRRVLKSNISARAFQAELTATVRGEYEHNISQQIYISLTAWAMVKTATEETIRLVNVAGSKVSVNDSATELGEKILEITSQIGKFPTYMAIEHIKKEFAQYFLQTTVMPESN